MFVLTYLLNSSQTLASYLHSLHARKQEFCFKARYQITTTLVIQSLQQLEGCSSFTRLLITTEVAAARK